MKDELGRMKLEGTLLMGSRFLTSLRPDSGGDFWPKVGGGIVGDIKDIRLLYLKGSLFLLLGLFAVALILWEHRDLRLAFLLGVAIWSFSRAYYFAFYVIEHYVDPTYRFAGIGSFVSYLWKRRMKGEG